MGDAPPLLGVNVLIVDEHGLLNVQLFERMLCCLALFYGPGRGPLIVFSDGSQDLGYAEALTYLQFNTVTEESRLIFRSQATVRELDVMNPEYEPDKLRIFHQDQQQTTYTAAYMNKVVREARGAGEKYLSVDRNGASHTQDPGHGVVQSIRFRRESQYNEFYVRGGQTGTLYKVTPSKWNYMNWTVITHPLACLLAMNTYDCQGCTVHNQVLYHPPRYFAMSPIKPPSTWCSLEW
ncbi:hypothetical protein DPEC_G00067810 [Dallia pectoralis]|uniref:Uncharacterized protein n=1 Tax=Dallia pectoralis TaxID=75939 RepID=A0ACC2H1F8_DALPE|nr:hypothetical protein DPEC_G00067810 [Dallia pectoralis]